ncbi:hypothetical protein [Bacillus pseudomycoides]|uniref:hypothetical protein n=1 Tax=Bacillus pseudomycoides TaxID=64104 RepID=UPI000BEE79F2|nr:hypothetical protein [Bacillus pseudomycoides]MED4653488.1 hypothetical protein [Bacillus pseudomycoides]PDX98526.1 hypothetical protein COO07_21420 [Bacillus pseudomycoides]PEB40516.1 hypothetical protein COO06_16935 [Bacillus pseudomycoides]PEE07554.1 hypothetical protein CON86_03075 [Bacillus pseudomycoides]PEK77735.1 hypothetical protein CN597_18980 [Bacillus pseudomycoides]
MQVVVERTTQLVPPALANTVIFTQTVEADIESVIPEKVVICGVVHKTLTYTAVLENGTLVPGFQVFDDIPFQCVIDREDANEGDLFEVTGVAILGQVSAQEQNFGFINDLRVAFKFQEKEIVKVCIRRLGVTGTEVAIGLGFTSADCNVPVVVPGRLLVNGIGFAGIPVSFTIQGAATVSPTTVFTEADGFFHTTVTAFGPGDITLIASGTVNGVPFFGEVTTPSPCV